MVHLASCALRYAASLAFAALLCGAAPAAADSDIRVMMDHARILKLDRSVSKVIIGNPEIADVTVSDPQTIVLTGRSFGATNLVIIDGAGNALVDERVVVSRDNADTLRVYRNTDPTMLTCSPGCESTVRNAPVN
ncbi:pilus assembly protein N-terminal domain-containing protein [Pararhizobium haloflavum]|uniref:pilus assembly protein N-terminal domain-containing protein n=1 Tax=Pararhizobium haloflavum TaxID=2037914 RepID=UPI000C18941E|nr:pilus assembly protein N-terminal domain-containing protein [Pararhizobium haloflavum]